MKRGYTLIEISIALIGLAVLLSAAMVLYEVGPKDFFASPEVRELRAISRSQAELVQQLKIQNELLSRKAESGGS